MSENVQDIVTNLFEVTQPEHIVGKHYRTTIELGQSGDEFYGKTLSGKYDLPVLEHTDEELYEEANRSKRNININILNNFPWAEILRANGLVARRSFRGAPLSKIHTITM